MGEKELTRRELMSDMTPHSRHTAGSWELLLAMCACVCVSLCASEKVKGEKKQKVSNKKELLRLLVS